MFYELTDHFIVSAPVEQTWEFFSSAENLREITPPWLGFTMRTPTPTKIQGETLLDYTIQWMGLPIRWRTKIVDWQPPRQFIDLQVKGPYALWHHQHTFEQTAEGVVCRDRVIYKIPLGPVGGVVNGLIVKRQLFDIFRYRRKVIGQRLGWVRAVQEDIVIKPL